MKSRGRELRDSTISMPRSRGDRARVDDRDAARQHRPQHAGGHGAGRARRRRRVDQRAVVADADRLDARRRPSATTSAPSRSASAIHGCSRWQFVGRNRREVDGVADDAVAQEVADGGGGLDADQFLRFFGRRGDVRRGDDLRQLRRATSPSAARFRTRRGRRRRRARLRSRGAAPPRRSARRARC